jgi:putative transposase
VVLARVGVAERDDVLVPLAIDQLHLKTPYNGPRQMARHLRHEGYVVGRKRIRRLMQKMGLCAVHQRPHTAVPAEDCELHPYLLRVLVIDRPNQGL